MYRSKDGKVKYRVIPKYSTGEWAATHYDLTPNLTSTQLKWKRSESKTSYADNKQDAIDDAIASIAHYDKHHPVTLDTYSITANVPPYAAPHNIQVQAISLLAAVNQAHQALPSNADIISAVRTT